MQHEDGNCCSPCIGVLALQGAFTAHLAALRHVGVHAIEVRYPHQLPACHGLILPGGESTTCDLQSQYFDFKSAICSYSLDRPLLGTCAGLIMLARWGILDIEVERNSYGRQSSSFSCLLPFASSHIPGVFIRAPKIVRCGSAITVLSSYEGNPIIVQQGNHIGTTCHPELSQDPTFYRYMLRLWQLESR